MKTLYLIVALSLLNFELFAQNPIPIIKDCDCNYGPTRIIVKSDPLTRVPTGNVPFDRCFVMRFYFVNSGDVPLRVYLIQDRDDITKSRFLPKYDVTSNVKDYDESDPNLKYYSCMTDVLMPPLRPNKKYQIFFVNEQDANILQHDFDIWGMIYAGVMTDVAITGNHTAFRSAFAQRDPAHSRDIPTLDELKKYYNDNKIGDILKKYNGDLGLATSDLLNLIKKIDYIIVPRGQIKIFQTLNYATAFAPTQYTIQTNAALHIIADAGLIYAGWQPGFNTVLPYVGINISPFRQFDSDIPFSYLRSQKLVRRIDYRRITVNIGLTVSTIAKEDYRDNLFGGNNVMIGLGYKLSHVFNINVGGLLYNNIGPNPLENKKTVGIAPYAGLSINLKIRDALGDLANVFSYGK